MSNLKLENLQNYDQEVYDAISKEYKRQKNNIELIASENIVSKAVLEAQGSILTNKYAEGYPSRRYYGGCEFVDITENLAIERAKELFKCNYANVQPHSGTQANFGVFLALLNPGDTILGMDLSSGGHLTHGSQVSVSGKYFNCHNYFVDKETLEIDYKAVEELALKHKPKLIIAGASSYSKTIDFKIFKEIADKVGAYLMVDMAHIAGLVAVGLHPSPFPYADVATSTTHKTLRGPRGGLIVTNDEELSKKLNSAVFPGSQGGPLAHVIAAKAVAFKEALQPAFKEYISNVLLNSKTMCERFIHHGFNPVSGISQNHLFLIDVYSTTGNTGKQVEKVLDSINITCNKNSLPFDNLSYLKTSGIRIGTPAITSRGFTPKESTEVVDIIVEALKFTKDGNLDEGKQKELQEKSISLCKQFPIYNEK